MLKKLFIHFNYQVMLNYKSLISSLFSIFHIKSKKFTDVSDFVEIIRIFKNFLIIIIDLIYTKNDFFLF